MKEVYIFSGLGADERVFTDVDFTGCNAHFVKWEIPEKRESMEAYAKRLSGQIKHGNPVLLGLSFGGIMAIEISKLIKTEKLILIASAKTGKEVPWYYQFMRSLRLYKLMPPALFLRSNWMTQWHFGTVGPEDRQLLKEILHDTSPKFFRWAIDKIAHWDNRDIPANITHIHGTADRIFPIRFVRCDIQVKDGGHFMTVNRADEISGIIKSIL